MRGIQNPARAMVTSAVMAAFMLIGCGQSETNAEKARREAEDNARLGCREAVRSAARFPSEADFPWDLGSIIPATGGGHLVAGDVKLVCQRRRKSPPVWRCNNAPPGEVSLSLST